jgi:hypothetical protein
MAIEASRADVTLRRHRRSLAHCCEDGAIDPEPRAGKLDRIAPVR